MGNTSNLDQWAGRERLAFIERVAWWRGAVNRVDLREVFGISAAQASADLAGYQDLNPTALAYNVRTKRYEARPEMMCELHAPRLEEALRMFLGTGVPVPAVASATGAGTKVDYFTAPTRRVAPEVERRIFLALDQGRRITMDYWSVSSSGKRRREIAPHALGHDGLRWHARAWCFENGDFRDFALTRMEGADWPGEKFSAPVIDEDWEQQVTLVFRPFSGLNEEQRTAMERDYGMTGGTLEVTVRRAMREYFLAQLRVPETAERPRHLEEVPAF